MLELLGALGGIILVDLALSGDNALVIGAAAAGLPRRERSQAILLGGAGAIILRILFAIAATLLLQLPFVQAIGGLVLLFIAARLLMERTGKHEEQIDEKAQLIPHATGATGAEPSEPSAQPAKSGATPGFVRALLTILVADVTMSLDNVLAIGALAHGDLPVLIFGLVVSIGLVLAGSALVANLIWRLPWLLDVAALVLGWTAAGMVAHDLRLGPVLHDLLPYSQIVLYTLGVGIVLAIDIFLRVRNARSQEPQGPQERHEMVDATR